VLLSLIVFTKGFSLLAFSNLQVTWSGSLICRIAAWQFYNTGKKSFVVVTLLGCLHVQKKQVAFYEGPAFIQPIRAIWTAFKKLRLVRKKPALSCKQHINKLTISRFTFSLFTWSKQEWLFWGAAFFQPIRSFRKPFRLLWLAG